MTTGPDTNREGNPHQAIFYRLGFGCFLGSIVAGLAAIEQPPLGFLCLGLAVMTCGFFGLFTMIYLKH